MTSSQIQTVKASWKVFSAIDPLLVGEVFYTQLFKLNPHLKQMFTTSKTEQAHKLIKMLNIIVQKIDNIEQLEADLTALSIRHANYGVKPAHYKAVGEALLWTIQQGLGADWNEDIRSAWAACYSKIAESMIHAQTH